MGRLKEILAGIIVGIVLIYNQIQEARRRRERERIRDEHREIDDDPVGWFIDRYDGGGVRRDADSAPSELPDETAVEDNP